MRTRHPGRRTRCCGPCGSQPGRRTAGPVGRASRARRRPTPAHRQRPRADDRGRGQPSRVRQMVWRCLPSKITSDVAALPRTRQCRGHRRRRRGAHQLPGGSSLRSGCCRPTSSRARRPRRRRRHARRRADFAEALHQVVPAASADDARPILTGVLMAAEGEGLRLVATDSYRLAVRDLPGASVLARAARACSCRRGRCASSSAC